MQGCSDNQDRMAERSVTDHCCSFTAEVPMQSWKRTIGEMFMSLSSAVLCLLVRADQGQEDIA